MADNSAVIQVPTPAPAPAAVPATETVNAAKTVVANAVPSESEGSPKQKMLAMTAWRHAASVHGYLKSGSFKPLPKKGTPEHQQIKTTQAQLVNEWQVTGIPAALVPKPKSTEKKTRKRKAASAAKADDAVNASAPLSVPPLARQVTRACDAVSVQPSAPNEAESVALSPQGQCPLKDAVAQKKPKRPRAVRKPRIKCTLRHDSIAVDFNTPDANPRAGAQAAASAVPTPSVPVVAAR